MASLTTEDLDKEALFCGHGLKVAYLATLGRTSIKDLAEVGINEVGKTSTAATIEPPAVDPSIAVSIETTDVIATTPPPATPAIPTSIPTGYDPDFMALGMI